MATGARQLVTQADGMLKPGLFSFITGGPKYDEAADLYKQAANQYKLASEWNEAASCFKQCAFCAQKSGSQSEEAGYLQEAGNVLRKLSTKEAVEEYEKAINILSASGRWSQAGKLLLSIAELYESERVGYSEAMQYYKRAAQMFDLDDHGKSNFTKCQLKVAEFAAREGQLQEAIKIFEQEGEKALGNSLLQYGAKEHFLKAGILHLVEGDTVTINLAIEKYESLDPRFGSSREGMLLRSLAEAYETKDVELFTEKLYEYDQMTKLDTWKMEFLMKVKDSITGGGTNLEGGALDLT